MFGRLLTPLVTPLVSRFDLSPRPEVTFESNEDRETTSAENFARDVMIEVMRNSVATLKEAESLKGKIEAMSEIHRIMVGESCTKDVFRELDGFLLLVNVLSILHPFLEQEGSDLVETREGARLAFMLFAEALSGDLTNKLYFEKHVGYHSIAEALNPLLKDSRTVDHIFGFLLSVAQDNFTLSDFFVTLRTQNNADFSHYASMLGIIQNPNAYSLLVTLLPSIAPEDRFLPKTVYSLTETLVSANHRNKALLSTTNLFRLVFEHRLDLIAPTGKLLKKLLDIGVDVPDVRYLFQQAIRTDGTLDTDVLDVIRSGMRVKWPAHFTMEGGASLQFRDENVKGLPSTGITFMIWMYIERFPRNSQTLFKVESKSRVLLQLSLRSDGMLELLSSANKEMDVLENAKIIKARWTHLVLVHHPHRASDPTIRIFIDGMMVESRHWIYPRTDLTTQTLTYHVGDDGLNSPSSMSWSMASSYLLSIPLSDDIPQIIQHLGPRYSSHFQTKDLYRFLTYEASTSLNIYLSGLVSQRMSVNRNQRTGSAANLGNSSTLRVLMDGIGVAEEAFLFSASPLGYRCEFLEGEGDSVSCYVRNGAFSPRMSGSRTRLDIMGDVLPVTRECLDTGLWKIGGSAVALRFIELSSTPHELSRALSIFADSARTSWQMSEDMERLRAYEILVHILRSKSQLINLTAFETLFEFLGLNFRNPDRSVIINTIAYRAIALDLRLWALCKAEIQQVHCDHFTTLLRKSKHRIFNAKQRLAKYGVVRKMLFVLQTNWYTPDMVAQLIAALKCVAQACFSPEDTIKPIVSYLAANLHEDSAQALSPISQIDKTYVHDKAEQVLAALVDILSTGNHLARFSAVLPLPRICLLLLGDNPSPVVAPLILTVIGLALNSASSFIRKFELVSGWATLKVALPGAWNLGVQRVALDVMFGRVGAGSKTRTVQDTPTVVCPYILPAILAALDNGLRLVVQGCLDEETTNAETFVESLLEELMELQTTSPTFRQVFKSQQATALLINAYSTFVTNGPSVLINRHNYIRILEKLNHFSMALTLDNVVGHSQKQELLAIFQSAEKMLDSDPTEEAPPPSDGRHKRPKSVLHVAHASVQILSERAFQKTATKIRDWRKNIIASEKKRLRRTALDMREYDRQTEQNNEWRTMLHDDRGIWALEGPGHSWVLDETEGPCRVRKKMQRKFESSASLVVGNQDRAVLEPDTDTQSFVQVEIVVPPWQENYEFHPTHEDQWIDEFADDKLRRVRHELESGDVIEMVSTVTRIVGVDSSPGLLILGRSHLYMLDGLVEKDDGEVIEAWDAPRNLFTVPGSVLELDGKQRAQKWPYDQLGSFSEKTCLFRDVALELYFKDSRSLLIVFPNRKKRQQLGDKLSDSLTSRNGPLSRSPLLFRTPLLGRMNSKMMSGYRDELSTAQRKWQAREISNFSYITVLNQASGRTPGDATQYPVFPWVLADYSSETLDLSSPGTFRDLSRPMGALSEARREAARQRFDSLKSVGEKSPFNYGTHFSSSMIVCHFLIRLEPFAHMFKTLQGGDWDLPERLFVDIARAYHSASQDVRGDVRELIPEFYTCPEFLQNLANLDFGVQQNTGEKIHDVNLPPWAKGDPLLFITEHRKALESDIVSENLPSWIDLIWGCKQRDPDSLNVFHPFSYEGSIDLDTITDELEREATVGIIHNFGQTPRKLFDAPHPSRMMHGPTTLPLGMQFGAIEDVQLLVQSSRPSAEISEPIASLAIDTVSERVIPCPKNILLVPQFPHEQIAWGFVDQSIKLLVDRKVMEVAEAISCVCIAFVDSNQFLTGSTDSMLRLWQISRKDNKTSISRTHLLRGHEAGVLCVATCRSWSIVVSGSEDGTAIIWDLNRAIYVRSIAHKPKGQSSDKYNVYLVAINQSTGYIATCSLARLCLHTINAYPIVDFDLSTAHPSDGRITSLAFHEREYARLGMLATGTDSGTVVLRTWTAAETPNGWKFVMLRRLRCREGFDGSLPKVTAVEFIGESLYHGEESGKVYSWDLPD